MTLTTEQLFAIVTFIFSAGTAWGGYKYSQYKLKSAFKKINEMDKDMRTFVTKTDLLDLKQDFKDLKLEIRDLIKMVQL